MFSEASYLMMVNGFWSMVAGLAVTLIGAYFSRSPKRWIIRVRNIGALVMVGGFLVTATGLISAMREVDRDGTREADEIIALQVERERARISSIDRDPYAVFPAGKKEIENLCKRLVMGSFYTDYWAFEFSDHYVKRVENTITYGIELKAYRTTFSRVADTWEHLLIERMAGRCEDISVQKNSHGDWEQSEAGQGRFVESLRYRFPQNSKLRRRSDGAYVLEDGEVEIDESASWRF
jgi:hypothetical protein